MSRHIDPNAILINNPFKLLYWLFFRGLALRRYARSIHPDLDEDLKVWEVRHAVGDDPRFRALCQVRWWLLAGAPLAIVLLSGAIFSFWTGFDWYPALFFSSGHTAGTLMGDALRWWFPRRASILLGWFQCIIVVTLVVAVPVLAALLSVLGQFSLPAIIALILVAFGVAVGVAGGVAGGVAVGVAVGVAGGVAGGVAFGVAVGVAFGVAFGVAYIISFLRLPIYLWELPRSLQLSGHARREPQQAARLWRKQPLHYDEVIQLPLIGLPEHIAAIARSDPEAGLEALADVGSSLRQQWAVPQALMLILDQELRRCTTPALIARFAEATAWLPTDVLRSEEQALLAELQSISRDTGGALAAATCETQEHNLRTQIERLRQQRTRLSRNDQARVRGYAEALEQWQRLLEAAATQVTRQRAQIGELPMPYMAGAILPTGSFTFRGRDDLFRELENLLINRPGKVTPLLLGQPRTGKTSALKQLPVRLGAQVLPVYLDMERRVTANHAAGLVADLVSEIRQAAQSHPQPLSLPALDERLIAGDPYRVFENWIDEVEQALGAQRWLFLTLDEFDRIDQAVKNKTMDERIFFMLRSLIQHHPRVLLALCGTFALEECDPRWYEALKSARVLPVTYLRRADARQVFVQPVADFPANVYQPDAVERALTLTNGHPLLLHALGERVISAYNASRQTLAPGSPSGLPLPVSAIEAAVPEVLDSQNLAFTSIWQWAVQISGNTELATQLLCALARDKPIDTLGDPAERAKLLELFCERELLYQQEDGRYAYQVPLLAGWVRQQRRMPRTSA